MKINFKVVLTGGLLGGALMLLPFVAKAQESGLLQQFPALEQLDLTAEQEAQISQVRQDARTQLESVLSAEQQQSVKASMDQGQRLERRSLPSISHPNSVPNCVPFNSQFAKILQTFSRQNSSSRCSNTVKATRFCLIPLSIIY